MSDDIKEPIEITTTIEFRSDDGRWGSILTTYRGIEGHDDTWTEVEKKVNFREPFRPGYRG